LTPLNQFVLKVHSRCDLACDHCYVYEAADQSWRGRPKVISEETLRQTAQRIAEHAAEHGLSSVQVVLHGGEPLMAGVGGLRAIITGLHSALRGVCELDLRVHTNGVQLTNAFCELFAEFDVRVGISIDGDRAANDRHRRYANGRSSYEQVVRAINLLRTDRFRSLYAGLLCTIDIANDPVAVYDALIALDPPRVDFLLPHATWDQPPPRDPGQYEQYADWLIAIFDRWLVDGRPTGVRTFESILSTLSGGTSFTEALGLAPATLAVIETDGTYEQVDSLKVTYDGAPATGLNVFSDGLDVVAGHPAIVARQHGLDGLSPTCQACPVVPSCGGGLYAHRYKTGSGFNNPSAFCADLFKLIRHVEQRLPQIPANHALPELDFLSLASGQGSASALQKLIDGQRTLRRTLVTAVYQAANSHAAVSTGARARLRVAWGVLAAVEAECPTALDRVLNHPFTRLWAVRSLGRLQIPHSGSAGGLGQAISADLDYLSALAASAAARAGVAAELSVPLIDGAVLLPTIGRLVVGPEHAELRTAHLIVDGDVVQFQVGEDWWKLAINDLLRADAAPLQVGDDRRSAEWRPNRFLQAAELSVAIEDGDPFRDCYGSAVTPPLSGEQFADWQRAFAGAWAEIEASFPEYAPAIRTGLTVLVPLAAQPEPEPEPERDGIGAAERHAFGTVAVSRPADPARLARLIVTAFQRAKFGAIIDLFDLCDPDAVGSKVASVQLEQAYAGLVDGNDDDLGRVIGDLTDSDVLTPEGRRFVAEMQRAAQATLGRV
jgi:uncharacterized protein